MNMEEYTFQIVSANGQTIDVPGQCARVSQLFCDLFEMKQSSVMGNVNGDSSNIITIPTPFDQNVVQKIAEFCRAYATSPFTVIDENEMRNPVQEIRPIQRDPTCLYHRDVLNKIPDAILRTRLISEITLRDLVVSLHPSIQHDLEMEKRKQNDFQSMISSMSSLSMFSNAPNIFNSSGPASAPASTSALNGTMGQGQEYAIRATEGQWIQYARYFQIDALENLLEYFIYYFMEKMSPRDLCQFANIPFKP
jgi:hypothetical protein